MMVLRDGAFLGSLDLDEVTQVEPHDGISDLKRERDTRASSVCYVRIQQEGDCLQVKKRALTRT